MYCKIPSKTHIFVLSISYKDLNEYFGLNDI